MRRGAPIVDALTSLKLALFSLALLMALVAACTLDQVHLGTFNAVDKYFRAFFLWWGPEGASWRVPVLPAGGAVGVLLLANLTATLVWRFRWERRKLGILLTHLGLIVLVLGEFVTGMFAVESQMAIEEGQSLNYSEEPRADELFVIDRSQAGYDEVFVLRDRALRDGREVSHPRWPFALRVRAYYPNAAVGDRPAGGKLPPSLADRGLGPLLVVQPQPEVSLDDARNQRTAFVEVRAGGRSLGTWLLSSAITAPQGFRVGDRDYSIGIRPARRYLPFTITLKDFSHDRYAGTEIPRNFSSLVRLSHPERGEDRDVLIYMNHPLRYEGRTFFQASFGKNDTLSVLQVVENPGWILPYASFALVGLGLLVQFLASLRGFKPAQETARRGQEAAAAA